MLAIPSAVSAQNTAGVPGPRIDEGQRALQYHATWDPDLDSFAQRLHYEEALDSRFMLRGIVQSRETHVLQPGARLRPGRALP